MYDSYPSYLGVMIIEWLQQVIQERGLSWICERFMEMKLIEEEDWKGEEVLLDIGLEKIFDSGYFIISPNSWVQYEYTINLENETIYMLGESSEEFWSFNNLDELLENWRN